MLNPRTSKSKNMIQVQEYDPSPRIMGLRLLHLPLEIVQLLLRQAVLDLGLSAAVRLRAVCSTCHPWRGNEFVNS